jgi:hypothetical protein
MSTGISHKPSPVKALRVHDVPICQLPQQRAPRIPTSAQPSPASHPKGKRIIEVGTDSDDDSDRYSRQPPPLKKLASAVGLSIGGSSTAGPSMAGTPILTNKDNPPKIWSYIRHLRGIIGVLYHPDVVPRPQESASLGALANDYLLAHGYTQPAINFIASTSILSPSAEGFVDSLVQYGLARTEAKFLLSGMVSR